MTLRARFLALLFSALAACSGAHAADRAGDVCAKASPSVVPLATVTNTRDLNFYCLDAALDDRANITALRFEKHEMRREPGKPAPVERGIETVAFAPADVGRPAGVVLDGTPGHDAILLQGDIAPGRPRAGLTVRYLYNGLTGEFRQCPVTLERSGAGWRLVNSGNSVISHIVVQTWGLPIVGTVGIQTLHGICG